MPTFPGIRDGLLCFRPNVGTMSRFEGPDPPVRDYVAESTTILDGIRVESGYTPAGFDYPAVVVSVTSRRSDPVRVDLEVPLATDVEFAMAGPHPDHFPDRWDVDAAERVARFEGTLDPDERTVAVLGYKGGDGDPADFLTDPALRSIEPVEGADARANGAGTDDRSVAGDPGGPDDRTPTGDPAGTDGGSPASPGGATTPDAGSPDGPGVGSDATADVDVDELAKAVAKRLTGGVGLSELEERVGRLEDEVHRGTDRRAAGVDVVELEERLDAVAETLATVQRDLKRVDERLASLEGEDGGDPGSTADVRREVDRIASEVESIKAWQSAVADATAAHDPADDARDSEANDDGTPGGTGGPPG